MASWIFAIKQGLKYKNYSVLPETVGEQKFPQKPIPWALLHTINLLDNQHFSTHRSSSAEYGLETCSVASTEESFATE